MDYAIGSRVTIRSWDDLEAEFGLGDSHDFIACPYKFTDTMRYLSGKSFTVTSVSDTGLMTFASSKETPDIKDRSIHTSMVRPFSSTKETAPFPGKLIILPYNEYSINKAIKKGYVVVKYLEARVVLEYPKSPTNTI